MKTLRFFLIIVLLVTLSSLTYGQERTKRGGLDVSVAGGYLIEREELTYYADISYSHNVLPLLGVGGGITAQIYSPDGYGYGDNNLYSPSINADWTISSYNFKYSKKIMYDFN